MADSSLLSWILNYNSLADDGLGFGGLNQKIITLLDCGPFTLWKIVLASIRDLDLFSGIQLVRIVLISTVHGSIFLIFGRAWKGDFRRLRNSMNLVVGWLRWNFL